jgi:hypothetical protein
MFHYFRIPYFTCTFFTKFIYNEYIGPYFFIACCSKFFASELFETIEKELSSHVYLPTWDNLAPPYTSPDLVQEPLK